MCMLWKSDTCVMFLQRYITKGRLVSADVVPGRNDFIGVCMARGRGDEENNTTPQPDHNLDGGVGCCLGTQVYLSGLRLT